MHASGFVDAPVSKGFLALVLVGSIVVGLTETKSLFWVAIKPHLTDYSQFWRLLIWQSCYTSTTEMLAGAIAIYQLRVIERLWGSRKFLSFLLSTLPYTTLLPPLLLCILRPLSFGRISILPAGPTTIIFALLAQYHAAIPYIYKYNMSGPQQSHKGSAPLLTSKSSSYILPMQLALSQVPGSAIAAAVGWLVGYAHRRKMLPGARGWRLRGWRTEKGKSRQE